MSENPAFKMNGNPTAKVRLEWLVKKIDVPGGHPSAGYPAGIPAYFDGCDHQELGLFSLKVFVEGTPDLDGNQKAVVQFLVSGAPHELLKKDARFMIAEGRHQMAIGVVEEGVNL